MVSVWPCPPMGASRSIAIGTCEVNGRKYTSVRTLANLELILNSNSYVRLAKKVIERRTFIRVRFGGGAGFPAGGETLEEEAAEEEDEDVDEDEDGDDEETAETLLFPLISTASPMNPLLTAPSADMLPCMA